MKKFLLLSGLYWVAIVVLNTALFWSCGFGAGHSEESNAVITACRVRADETIEYIFIGGALLYLLGTAIYWRKKQGKAE